MLLRLPARHGVEVARSRVYPRGIRAALCGSVIAFALLGIALVTLARAAAPARPDAPTQTQLERGTIDLGCPSFGGPPGTGFYIKVVRWCALTAPRRQWQLKFQVRIKNIGRRTLDISLPNIRLVMTHFNRARWSPPRRASAGAPYKATYKGQRVWFVPPNAEGAAEAYPPPAGNFTFATHWNQTSLAPGKTSATVYRRKGSVVFYLPRSANQTRSEQLDGVVGIAYVDGRRVLALCPPGRWGPKVPAGEF